MCEHAHAGRHGNRDRRGGGSASRPQACLANVRRSIDVEASWRSALAAAASRAAYRDRVRGWWGGVCEGGVRGHEGHRMRAGWQTGLAALRAQQWVAGWGWTAAGPRSHQPHQSRVSRRFHCPCMSLDPPRRAPTLAAGSSDSTVASPLGASGTNLVIRSCTAGTGGHARMARLSGGSPADTPCLRAKPLRCWPEQDCDNKLRERRLPSCAERC